MIALKLDTNALDRLMQDDDGKIKLELQQAVMEEFGRRHIKAFANDGPFREQLENVKKEAIDEVEKKFGKWESGGYRSDKSFRLHQTIKDAIQLHAKTVVTYELDEAEKHVAEIYKKTSQEIKDRYEKKVSFINADLEKYLVHLEEQTEQVKARLLTKQVDGIIRDHIKSILAESFAVTTK